MTTPLLPVPPITKPIVKPLPMVLRAEMLIRRGVLAAR